MDGWLSVRWNDWTASWKMSCSWICLVASIGWLCLHADNSPVWYWYLVNLTTCEFICDVPFLAIISESDVNKLKNTCVMVASSCMTCHGNSRFRAPCASQLKKSFRHPEFYIWLTMQAAPDRPHPTSSSALQYTAKVQAWDGKYLCVTCDSEQ